MVTFENYLAEAINKTIWNNANHQTAVDLYKTTPTDAKLKTLVAYHVTKRVNIAGILQSGFNLLLIKPRWKNDYAVSLSRGLTKATKYFTQVGGTFNTALYGVLEVTVKGRFFGGKDAPRFSTPNVGHTLDAKDYTMKLMKLGYDGQDQVDVIYVNNPKAILKIQEVSPA